MKRQLLTIIFIVPMILCSSDLSRGFDCASLFSSGSPVVKVTLLSGEPVPVELKNLLFRMSESEFDGEIDSPKVHSILKGFLRKIPRGISRTLSLHSATHVVD
jgi:hypothetical protein